MTAPHPLWFWLTKHGRIRVGKWIFPINAMQRDLANVLSGADLSGFDTISAFFTARDEYSELGPQLRWPRARLKQSASITVWKAVFEEIETREYSFARLHELWEAAFSRDAIPSRVPTSQGPSPLTEIFVTTDLSIGHGIDDGRIVLLSPECARAWIESGAQSLPETTLCFRRRLAEPAHLLDIFPELAASNELRDCLNNHLAVWVEDLKEDIGPRKLQRTVAMDADGAVILDRPKFQACVWSEGITLLLQCLERHRLLPNDDDFDDLLAKILDRRSEEARRKVREQSTLADRLLQAVGHNTDSLLSMMTSATRQALGNDVPPSEVAELSLAVYGGPAVLSRLRDTLAAQGLAPPKRWGGEPARTFVLELGFPLEFASTVGGRREAELSVSGPISLPPLHDYQREILKDIEMLLSSGVARRRAVISLPTGGGKTRVVAEAIVRLVLLGSRRRSVLWVAQTDELCEQAVQCFRQLWVNIGQPGEDLRIVRLWGGQRSPSPSESDEAVVVVASIQTLNSRSGRAELAWVTEREAL